MGPDSRWWPVSMQLINAPRYTTFGKTSLGELVVVGEADEQQIGIVVGKDGTSKLLGVLEVPKGVGGVGKFFPQEERTECLSFGTDWLPGVLFEAGTDSQAVEKGGALLLTPTGAEFRFRAGRIGLAFDKIAFDLESASPVKESTSVVAVRSWRIWASAEVRSAKGSKPLIDHV